MKTGSEINVKNIKEFYSSLKKEMKSSDQVVIDFTGTERIDSSAAQVILSAMNKAAELDKQITITGASPELKALLKLAGL